MAYCNANVCFWPKADMAPALHMPAFGDNADMDWCSANVLL